MIVNFNNFVSKRTKQLVYDLLCYAAKLVKVKNNISVNITMVSSSVIKKLNHENRNIDKVTDVLSFPLFEKDELTIKEMADENVLSDIGDIVICKKVMKKQAKTFKHSTKREFCFLVVHSFLHLCGYDHMTKDDEVKMNKLQNKILENFKVVR